MRPRARVLYVGHDSADASLLGIVLAAELPGTEVVHVDDPVRFGREIERGDFHLVVCDERLDWCGAARVLVEVQGSRPEARVVVLTEAETAYDTASDGLTRTTLRKSADAFLSVPEVLRGVFDASTPESPPGIEPRVRGLLDRSRIGVFRLTLDGRLLEADETFLRILGASTIDEARERDLDGLTPQVQGGFTESGRVYKREIRLQGGGGEPIRVAVAEVVNRDADGLPVLDGLLEDISDRHTAPMESPADATGADADRLVRSNEDLRMFASLAAHELKEPLRTIEQSTSHLLEDAGPLLRDDTRRSAELAVDGARRLQSMVEGLLALARSGGRRELGEPCDCNEIVAEVVESLRAKIAETDGRVKVKPLPTVRADPTQMRLVFRNLIANALEFHGDSPPRVRVSARQDGDDWVFRVRDRGVGIPTEQSERIFERFARGDRGSGAGLGLAICKSVVERHGGRIWVESEPGSGSTFLFTIPLSVARPSDDQRPAEGGAG